MKSLLPFLFLTSIFQLDHFSFFSPFTECPCVADFINKGQTFSNSFVLSHRHGSQTVHISCRLPIFTALALNTATGTFLNLYSGSSSSPSGNEKHLAGLTVS